MKKDTTRLFLISGSHIKREGDMVGKKEEKSFSQYFRKGKKYLISWNEGSLLPNKNHMTCKITAAVRGICSTLSIINRILLTAYLLLDPENERTIGDIEAAFLAEISWLARAFWFFLSSSIETLTFLSEKNCFYLTWKIQRQPTFGLKIEHFISVCPQLHCCDEDGSVSLFSISGISGRRCQMLPVSLGLLLMGLTGVSAFIQPLPSTVHSITIRPYRSCGLVLKASPEDYEPKLNFFSKLFKKPEPEEGKVEKVHGAF